MCQSIFLKKLVRILNNLNEHGLYMFVNKAETAAKIRKNTKYARINCDADTDPYLTSSEKDLLSVLSIMAGDTRSCWPSIGYICRMLDLNFDANKRNVRRRLAKLEYLGYIERRAQYQKNTSGRQTSNNIEVNYICSLTKVTQEHMQNSKSWDVIFSGIDNILSKSVNGAFTPPRNIIDLNKKKEEIDKEERKRMLLRGYPHTEMIAFNPLSSSRSPRLPEEGGQSLKVDHIKFPFKRVTGWYKTISMGVTTKTGGFHVVRSKSGKIRLSPRKDKVMNSNTPVGKKDLTSQEWDEINAHLGIVEELAPPIAEAPNPFIAKPIPKDMPQSSALAAAIELLNSCVGIPDVDRARGQKYVNTTPPIADDTPRYGMEYLSTNSVGKPVDEIRISATVNENIGGKVINWTEICSETNKRNITFQCWTSGLSFRFVQDRKLYLYAKNRFWQEMCEQRFVSDILNACKFLSLPISWVEITVKE